MTVLNIISLGGTLALMGLAWLMSADRRRVNWRVVVWGSLLQMSVALVIFTVPAGRRVFLWVNDGVVKVVGVAGEGARFLFGPLALPAGAAGSIGFILAFQVLPAIVFFAALVALLYHYRILPWLIEGFARVFTRWMGTSGAESLCAASNVFVGIESALAVRPHLERMTRSELCTVLTAMMATIASSVLGSYVLILEPQFPHIAGHLVSASLMSAPAALVMSKLIYPERGIPETLGVAVKVDYQREPNAVVAVINGTMAGGKMVFGIGVLLIAVLGLVGLAGLVTGGVGGLVNRALGLGLDWSLAGLAGYLFLPVTYLLGIDPADAPEVARLIGQRALVTEVPSYQELAQLLAAGALVDHRSAVLASYALCGFAHIASLGIFVGGIAALVPSRVQDLAAVSLRALVAANLACLMTASVAGIFLTGGSVLLGK